MQVAYSCHQSHIQLLRCTLSLQSPRTFLLFEVMSFVDAKTLRTSCLRPIPRSNGHMRIVKLLLRAGAAVNSENLKGQVLLQCGAVPVLQCGAVPERQLLQNHTGRLRATLPSLARPTLYSHKFLIFMTIYISCCYDEISKL
jgi:hypothetical protein